MNATSGGIFYKVVYSVSDNADLILRALSSIKSLEKFVSKDNIIVFYTPPRSEKNQEKLSKLAIVKEAENVTKPFDARVDRIDPRLRGPQRYGEKVHLCEVDFPNVVFLDADTIVKKDISPLLVGDFDFCARAPVQISSNFNPSVWKTMFANINREPVPMFNAGFLIFKNYLHLRIRDTWLQYINDDSLPNPNSFNCKEQWALSMALATVDARVRYMTFEQHALMWRGEKDMETCVLHGRLPPRYRRFRCWVGNKRRRVQRLLLSGGR
jgi:hypothetical protein